MSESEGSPAYFQTSINNPKDAGIKKEAEPFDRKLETVFFILQIQEGKKDDTDVPGQAAQAPIMMPPAIFLPGIVKAPREKAKRGASE